MASAGKSQQDQAKYVFDSHGCKSCHTMGQNGKLGFTDRGKERAKGFEGCISMLTAMNLIAQVPDDKRSPDQRKKASRFEEFGCTTCHKITPGKMGLTDGRSQVEPHAFGLCRRREVGRQFATLA